MVCLKGVERVFLVGFNMVEANGVDVVDNVFVE